VFANAVNVSNFSGGLGGNKLAPGKSGQAVQFTGDDELSFPGTGGIFPAGPIHGHLLALSSQIPHQRHHLSSRERDRRRFSRI
jgi:hypothetical protein